MINLDVEEYCHDCPDFQAETRKSEIDSFDGSGGTEIMVFCKHERRCAAVARFLRKEFEKKNGNI